MLNTNLSIRDLEPCEIPRREEIEIQCGSVVARYLGGCGVYTMAATVRDGQCRGGETG